MQSGDGESNLHTVHLSAFKRAPRLRVRWPATRVAVRWTHRAGDHGRRALKPAASKQERERERERERKREREKESESVTSHESEFSSAEQVLHSYCLNLCSLAP